MSHKRKPTSQRGKKPKVLAKPTADVARVQIIKALNNGRFVARTLGGISKETSIDRSLLIQYLRADPELKAQVKVLPRRTRDGKLLVTTKDHFRKSASFSDKFIDMFASQRVTLKDAD